MKNFTFIIIIFASVIFLNLNSSFAQEVFHGTWGMSAVVNNSQADLLFPIWLGNSNTIAPAIGVSSISDVQTDISFGFVFHHYINSAEKFSPLWGFRGGVIIGSPKSGSSTTDILTGIGAGGEYFFSEHFSVGVEGQFNVIFSDDNSSRFGNPGGTNFNTGSVFFATIYF
jgi:hypothetical protein